MSRYKARRLEVIAGGLKVDGVVVDGGAGRGSDVYRAGRGR